MKHNYESTLIERDGVYYNRDTNKPHSGHIISYHQNGQKKSDGTFKDGKLIEVTWWDEAENLIKQFPPHHVCYF